MKHSIEEVNLKSGARGLLIDIPGASVMSTRIEFRAGMMYAKNHDYDEAWRLMRPTSYTDLILSKVHRTKQIEDNQGVTLVSEGIDANYMDMVNYALFGLIRIEYA